MNKEFPEFQQMTSVPDGEYAQSVKERLGRAPIIPKVNIFQLSEREGWRGLGQALSKYVPFEARGQQGILSEAVKRGIIVDTFRSYLVDRFKRENPEGYTLKEMERYVEENDRWENSNVVERPWKTDGTLVRLPKEDDFFEEAYSRLNLILSADEKKALRNAKIVAEGLGVGWAATYLLALSGAQNLTIIDGGRLPPHKFNRFIGADVGDIGKSYVEICMQKLLEANPYLHLTGHAIHLGANDEEGTLPVEGIVKEADIVIEETDNKDVKIASRVAAKKYGRHLIMASDVETSTVIEYQGPNDEIWPWASDEDQQRAPKNLAELTVFANAVIGQSLIPRDILTQAVNDKLGYWPQDGAAAFLSAAGIRLMVVDILRGRRDIPRRTILEWKEAL